MNEELLDVVNELDEVVGRRPRCEVHRLGLKHRAVHLLVFNRGGGIFLQKRSMTKDCFPGAWDSSAAGHLDAGEDYDACAVRELREELGFEVEGRLERLFKIEACPATGEEFVWVYRCKAEGPFRLNAEEIESGGWFSPGDVEHWLNESPESFASGFVRVWREYMDRGYGAVY